jgi:hypothetical protein
MSEVIYRCGHCEIEQPVDSRVRIYESDDGNSLGPVVWIEWCRDCARVVEIEYVPTMEMLREEFILIERNAPYEERLFTLAFDRAVEIDMVKKLMAWRSRRCAPSKCFECGGTELVLPARMYGELPCPRCAGELRAYIQIMAGSHHYGPDVYSLEGTLLRRGAGLIGCYSSWGLPPDRG